MGKALEQRGGRWGVLAICVGSSKVVFPLFAGNCSCRWIF